MFEPLWLTLKVAILATMLAGATGIGLGWWMARRRFAGHALVDAFLMMPLVLPPTVLGYYLIVLIGRNGILGRYLDQWFGINLMFTWQGAVLAAALVSLPLKTRTNAWPTQPAPWVPVSGRFFCASHSRWPPVGWSPG